MIVYYKMKYYVVLNKKKIFIILYVVIFRINKFFSEKKSFIKYL